MDMIGLVGGVASYGIAKVISGRVVKDRQGRRLLYGATVTGLFISLFAAATFLVNPMVRPALAVSSLESSLDEYPALAAMKSAYPQAYAELIGQFKADIRNDPFATTDDVVALGRAEGIAVAYAGRRISLASNEAAVRYFQRQVKVMALLNNFGECYHFALKPAEDVLSFKVHIPSADWLELQKSAAEVLTTSAATPQALPAKAEADLYLQPVLAVMVQKYGDTFELLAKKDLADGEKTKYCAITIDLFQEILKQPPTQAGQLLRYLGQSAT